MTTLSNEVIIYTDGGADPNPGIGGWAAILRYGERERVLMGNDPQTTNNRMELTAALSALQALKRPCTIQFYTDSQYLQKGIQEWITSWIGRNWQQKDGRAIANADLWQPLWEESQKHTIHWHWVRGHAGNDYNERCDVLAREARLQITPTDELNELAPHLYIKSSYLGQKQQGGWGVVLQWGDLIQEYTGGESPSTANRMELQAAITAVNLLPPQLEAHIFTTNDYLFQGVTMWRMGWRKRNWRKKEEDGGEEIANADLWRRLDEVLVDRPIRWQNAKGWQHPHLERAGELARQQIH